MGRYTGPVCRQCRQVGEKLFLKGERCFTPKCAIDKHRAAPGSQRPARRRPSDYAIRLHEKQKVRYAYGLREYQFLRNVKQAQKQPGITGQYLMQLLERRLDNVVYRLNFSDSRAQARQMVMHGHCTVNGRKVDIPSFVVKAGDEISWKESSMAKDFVKEIKESIPKRAIPRWLVLDAEALKGKVAALPEEQDIGATVDTRLIVEFYSR
jgi:small subunit ribosomal protein S4